MKIVLNTNLRRKARRGRNEDKETDKKKNETLESEKVWYTVYERCTTL